MGRKSEEIRQAEAKLAEARSRQKMRNQANRVESFVDWLARPDDAIPKQEALAEAMLAALGQKWIAEFQARLDRAGKR